MAQTGRVLIVVSKALDVDSGETRLEIAGIGVSGRAVDAEIAPGQGLVEEGVRPHADEAETLFPVDPRTDGLGVVDSNDLRAIVLGDGKTAGLGEAVRLVDWRVLVEVLG